MHLRLPRYLRHVLLFSVAWLLFAPMAAIAVDDLKASPKTDKPTPAADMQAASDDTASAEAATEAEATAVPVVRPTLAGDTQEPVDEVPPASGQPTLAVEKPETNLAAKPADSTSDTPITATPNSDTPKVPVDEKPNTASAEQSDVESPQQAAKQPPAEKALEPIPDPREAGPVEIETASFKEVTPGVTTMEQVREAWGPPAEINKQSGLLVHLYKVEPFERVEVTFSEEKATSIVIRLNQAFPADAVAKQLELSNIRPVLVSNELGQVLGQSFPERGVLFAFQPSEEPGKVTMKVAQIILEPVAAESFVLRAETNLDTDYSLSLRDLDQAIKLAPNNARAHWLRARLLSAMGDLAEAQKASDTAVRLEPANARFHVTRAQILGQADRLPEAIEEAEKALQSSDQRPHVKARTLCLLGDLCASGSRPDYKRAMNYHSQAIKMADPLTVDRHPAIRLAAKEVVIDAHLGAAHDIAWGYWNQKEVAVPRWLDRASEFADDLIENDGGTTEHRFRVAARALAAYVGVRGKLDPTLWTEKIVQNAEELIASTEDAAQQQQFRWDLGLALYDAVQIYQMRAEYEVALKYGKLAIGHLEQGAEQRPETPADLYLLGRLQFRLGAIQAVGKENHADAITWFEKAIPVLKKSIPEITPSELGRLGETFVSMGISYWEVGQRDKGLELTQEGTDLMEKAVRGGSLDESALAIPYGNLATMHRQLGQETEAEKFARMATQTSDTMRR